MGSSATGARAQPVRQDHGRWVPHGKHPGHCLRGAALRGEKQIDASLQRLTMDLVELYQCHRYDADTPLDETMEALTAVVRSGKARGG